MVVSLAAGAVVLRGSTVPGVLWAVPFLYLLRMALNAMDGLMAREHAMTSPGGSILNEVGDAVSDAVAYLPFALLLPQQSVLVAIVVAVGLIAEVTALASADESGRRNEGPFGKSDRALAFGLLAVVIALGAPSVAVPVLLGMTILGAATICNRAGNSRGAP